MSKSPVDMEKIKTSKIFYSGVILNYLKRKTNTNYKIILSQSEILYLTPNEIYIGDVKQKNFFFISLFTEK